MSLLFKRRFSFFDVVSVLVWMLFVQHGYWAIGMPVLVTLSCFSC